MVALLVYWNFCPNKKLSYCIVPQSPPNLVGRAVDSKKLLDVINFSNLKCRIIDVRGPPGVGKSALVQNIAKEMQEDANVCFFHLDELSGQLQQSLGLRLLGASNVTMNELRTWARNHSDTRILIVLDGCDSHINYHKENFKNTIKEFITYSKNLKFLTTSQEEVLHSMHCCHHNLEPVSEQYSMDILDYYSDSHLNGVEKKALAEVTGGIPLALELLGALFNSEAWPASPKEIAAQINKTKYDFAHLPQMHFIINISYYFLNKKQQEVGRYLAYFPQPFDEPAIDAVLSYLDNDSSKGQNIFFQNTVVELSRRSLLVYDKQLNRYHFHGLIKKFFLTCSNSSEEQSFGLIVQRYFSAILCEGASEYLAQPKEALLKLDADRHNFLYFLTTLHDLPNASYSTYLNATKCFEKALSIGYLSRRFSSKELVKPIESVTDFLAGELSKSSETLTIYVNLVHHLASVMEEKTEATMQYAKRQHIMSRFSNTNEYVTFYRHFTTYESQLYSYEYKPCFKDKKTGKHTCKGGKQVIFLNSAAKKYFQQQLSLPYANNNNLIAASPSNDKILMASAQSTSVLSNTNDYDHYEIGMHYLHVNEYASSAKHLEKALSEGSYTFTLREVDILLHLEKYYKLTSDDNKHQFIINLLTNRFFFLKNQSMSIILNNLEIYSQYMSYLKASFCPDDHSNDYINVNSAFDQYVDLNELVFEAVVELGDKSQLSSKQIQQSSFVANVLYLRNDFSRAAKIASYALNHTSPEKVYFSVHSGIIFAKSMYKLRNYSGANVEFTRSIDIIVSNNNTEEWMLMAFKDFQRESCNYLIYLGNFHYVIKWALSGNFKLAMDCFFPSMDNEVGGYNDEGSNHQFGDGK